MFLGKTGRRVGSEIPGSKMRYQAGPIKGNYPAGKFWRHCFRVVLKDGTRKMLTPIRHWLRTVSKNVNSQELLVLFVQKARRQSSGREMQVLSVGRESTLESGVYKNDKEIPAS